MENYLEVLRKCPLFYEIKDKDLSAMLRCLGVKIFSCAKGKTIMSEGEQVKCVGIVLSGAVQLIRVDYFGNRSIVVEIGPGELFGESFACAGVDAIPINAVTVEPTQVMFLDCLKIIHSCSNACEFHQQMIYNLLKVVAEKNLALHQKIEITSKRSTREKLVTYLLTQAKKKNSDCFEIPYNRQELADYLEVERSGLSVEIGKLRRQGFIETDRKKFKIMKKIPFLEKLK